MADSIFSQNPLDDAIAEHTTPKQQLDPRAEIEKIAIETNVPVNVLMAVNEQLSSNTPEQSVDTARQTAARIAEGMSAGQDVETVIRGFIGNDEAAGKFLDRARAIGNEFYPLQEDENASEGSFVGDMARQVGGGVVKGAGHIIEGAGRAVDTMRPQGPELHDDGQGGFDVVQREGPSDTIIGSRRVAERVRASGEGLQAGVSDGARAAITGSTPDGDIFSPSTWTLGEEPSLKGYMLLGADVLGSFLPIVATSMATGGVGATVTGGLQGGGAASETAGDIIDAAAAEVGESGKSRLEEESSYYRELIADGKSPEQALAVTKEAATKYAALLTAPVSAFGGAATSKIMFGGLSKAVGGSMATRIGASAGASALEEGAQEVAESVATKVGVEASTGIDQNLTEGTFADFVLGAIGGAGPGAVSGIPNNTNTEIPPDGMAAASEGGQPVVSGNGLDGAAPEPDAVGLPAPSTGPEGAAPTLQEPEPSGPLGRAMQAAPKSMTPHDLARGDIVTVAGDGFDGFEATFIEETPHGVLIEDPDNGRSEIPRSEFEGGMVSLSRYVAPVEPDAIPAMSVTEEQASRPVDTREHMEDPIAMRGGEPSGAALAAQDGIARPTPHDDTPKTSEEAQRRIDFINNQAKSSGWNTRLTSLKADLQLLKKILSAEERGEKNVLPENDEIFGHYPEPGDLYDDVIEPTTTSPDIQPVNAPESAPEPADIPDGSPIDQEAIADEQAQEIPAPEPVEAWDSATAQQREETLIQSGFTTKAGKLNAPGKKLLESAWADIRPAAQKRIYDNPIPTEPSGPSTGPMVGSHTRTDPTPTLASLPEGAFSGTEEEFASLTPGMRREIQRSAKKTKESPKGKGKVAQKHGETDETILPDATPSEPVGDDVPARVGSGRAGQDPDPLHGGDVPKGVGDAADAIAAPDASGDNTLKNAPVHNDPTVTPNAGDVATTPDVGVGQLEQDATGQTDASSELDVGYEWDRMSGSQREQALKDIGVSTNKDGNLNANARRIANLPWDQLTESNQASFSERAGPVLTKRNAVSQQRIAENAKARKDVGEDTLNAMETRHKDILGHEPYKIGGHRFTDLIAEGAQTGRFNDAYLPDNKAARTVFEEFTGNKLPRTIKGTKQFLLDGAPFNLRDHNTKTENPTAKEIHVEAAQAHTDPTDAQKEAGNYRKGHVKIHGMDIAIENAKGSERSGTDGDGQKWSVTLPAHYGDLKRTEGADGDPVDVYIGENPESDFVLIVDQIDLKTKAFDEHKVILGAKDQADAAAIYKGGFSDGKGRARMGANKAMTVAEFKEWLAGDTTKPVALAKKKATKPKPSTPTAKKKLSPKKVWAKKMDDIKEYFNKGNVVRTYDGSFDQVISFEAGPDGAWVVTVEGVQKEGSNWVPSDSPARRRKHATEPSALELKRGPVEVAKVKARTPDEPAKKADTQPEIDEMYSRFDGDDNFAAQMVAELANNDELFAYPVVKNKGNIKAIMGEIAPNVKFIGDTQRSDEQQESGADRRYLLRSATGKDFYVFETDESVWIDVSQLETGDGGNAIYAAIGDYAANTGLVFIGDPDGLSKEALRRRTEVMVSLALRRGSTDHIAPHEYQLKGDKTLGVPPLKWTDGDFYTNLQSLIEVSTESLAHHVPEIKNARYDFETRTFRTSKGDPLTDEALADWSDTQSRIRAAGAGYRTLKRSILQNTLLRQESGRQPGLLERFIRQSDKHVKSSLSATFYDRSTGAWPNAGTISKAQTKDLHRRLNAELKRVGIASKVNLQFLPSMVDNLGRPVQGSQRGSEIKVSQKAVNPIDTLNHEIIHALRNQSLWRREFGLFTKTEWQALVRAARSDKALLESVKANYPDLSTAQQTEEAVAELYRQWRAGEKWDDTTVVGKVEPILRRIWSFFEAVSKALNKSGLEDHATIFKRIQRGEVGARSRGPDGKFESSDAKFMREYAESPVAKTEAEYDAKESKLVSRILTNSMSGAGNANILALVPGRPLYNELGKGLKSAEEYLRLKEKMDTTRNDWHEKTDTTAKAWRKILSKNGKANVEMMSIMHDSTIAGQDPSQPFVVKALTGDREIMRKQNKGDFAYENAQERVKEDAGNKAAHSTLKQRFDNLPPEFQAMFETVRNQHAEMGDAFEVAILANVKKAMTIGLERAEQKYNERLVEIKDDGLTGDEKAEAEAEAAQVFSSAKKRNGWNVNARLSSLRAEFETKKAPKPYFPLIRYGKFFVTVRDDDGKVLSFSKFEKVGEQETFIREQKRENAKNSIEHGVIGQDAENKDMVSPTFVADVEAILGDQINDPGAMDLIWQKWLETLPDYSVRQSRIHRKGTKGYSNDAFRAFGRQLFHGSHQLARLQYGLDLGRALEKAAVEASTSDDPNRNGLIVHEMQRRHEHVMNPKGEAWAQTATSAAFIYYLAVSPSAAMVNVSQTTVLGIPILASGFKKAGITRSSRALMKAMGDFTRGKGHAANSDRLTNDEKAAMEQAYRRGTVDKSQSHDLAGVSESGVEYSERRTRVMAGISYFFHHAERLNREITFLAAYRLARDNDFNHEAAIQKGADLTWKVHFDYAASSRPRPMQNSIVRVMMVFRNFQINMLWRLFRDTHQAFNGADAETRKEARSQLIGISTSMLLQAGIRGVWGYGILTMLLGTFFPGGEDDVEDLIQTALVNTFGPDVAGAFLNGVPGHLTGINLTSRIGMPELWFRSSDRMLSGRGTWEYFLEQNLGASINMGKNIVVGAYRIAEGEIWRGVETMSPKFMRDTMKSIRYYNEGVQTFGGDDVVKDINIQEAFAQAIGFSPARVSEQYRANNKMRNTEKRITNQRKRILATFRADIHAGRGRTDEAKERMRAFNREYPEWRITRDSIRRSIRASKRYSEQTEGGLRLNPRLDKRIRREAAPALYD